MLTANASTKAYVRWESQFQYPPFPSLPGNYDAAAYGDSITHYGSCVAPHLAQYVVVAGVK